MEADEPAGWSEENSELFLEFGRIVTPRREEIGEAMLDLLPAQPDEPFLAIDIGIGGGWLSAALLERFQQARIVGLDGSPTMLREATRTLERFPDRFELRQFSLEDTSWAAELGTDIRCFVSSLIIHHLDGAGKQRLYQTLHHHLTGGGALLIADVVAPASERERRHMERAWDETVRLRSERLTGSLDTYERFLDEHWNLYEYPDPMDQPSTVPEHLRWLEEAGFEGANVFWERAGHAVYGGYRAS